MPARSSQVGQAIDGAVRAVRAETTDPTAAVVVLTPSVGTKEIARRALGTATNFIRVRFTTPSELISDLGRLDLVRGGRLPEPAGWLQATLLPILRDLQHEEPLSRHAEILTRPGWLPTLTWALRELEGAGLAASDLASVDHPDGDRIRLLEALMDGVQRARDQDGLFSPADLARAAKTATTDPSLPINQNRGVVVLGDTALSQLESEALRAFIARRPGARLVLHPLENVPPAPYGLRAAAADLPAIPVYVAGDTALEHLRRTLFSPASEPARDDSVQLYRSPDESREMREVVRKVSRPSTPARPSIGSPWPSPTAPAPTSSPASSIWPASRRPSWSAPPPRAPRRRGSSAWSWTWPSAARPSRAGTGSSASPA